MAAVTRRPRAPAPTPAARLVGELLQRLADPRPAEAMAALLLARLGFTRGFALLLDGAVCDSLADQGGALPAGLAAAAFAAVRDGETTLTLGTGRAAVKAVVLGQQPALVLGAPAAQWGAKASRLVGLWRRAAPELGAALVAGRRIERLLASEAALAAAGREKEEFTGFLLHDLRNPLTIALTNLEYLREAGVVLEADAQAALVDTEASVSLVVDHLGGLLDIAQLEEARMTVRREPLPVGELLRSVVDQFDFAARRQGVRLTCACGGEPTFALDHDLLRRLIHNLLTTSLRVTPPGGWVDVQARIDAPLFTLSVASSGPAVPEEARSSLFTKYRRLGAGGRSDTHAHGLGLYFVRLAAEAHGGSVRAEGRPDGSAFVVQVPAPPPDAASAGGRFPA